MPVQPRELATLSIRAITDKREINILDMPGPMIEITIGRMEMTFTPMQADSLCRELHRLTKLCREAAYDARG